MPRSQSAAADTDPPTPPADGDPAPAAAPARPQRFTAPGDIAGLFLSTGREIRVENGTLTVPDDLSDDERRQIVRAGFTPA